MGVKGSAYVPYNSCGSARKISIYFLHGMCYSPHMVRTLILAISATLMASPITDPHIDQQSIQSFNHSYSQFFRRYYGCPLDRDFTSAECYVGAGFVDLDSWRRSREAAKVLFGLH